MEAIKKRLSDLQNQIANATTQDILMNSRKYAEMEELAYKYEAVIRDMENQL